MVASHSHYSCVLLLGVKISSHQALAFDGEGGTFGGNIMRRQASVATVYDDMYHEFSSASPCHCRTPRSAEQDRCLRCVQASCRQLQCGRAAQAETRLIARTCHHDRSSPKDCIPVHLRCWIVFAVSVRVHTRRLDVLLCSRSRLSASKKRAIPA